MLSLLFSKRKWVINMHLNHRIIMAAIVHKATGRLEEMGGFLVKMGKKKRLKGERGRGCT